MAGIVPADRELLSRFVVQLYLQTIVFCQLTDVKEVREIIDTYIEAMQFACCSGKSKILIIQLIWASCFNYMETSNLTDIVNT